MVTVLSSFLLVKSSLVLVVFPLASFTSTTVWVPPSVSGVTLVVVDETGAPESVVTVSVVTVAVPVVVGVDAVVVVCTLPFGSVVVVGGDTTVGPIGGAGGAGPDRRTGSSPSPPGGWGHWGGMAAARGLPRL